MKLAPSGDALDRDLPQLRRGLARLILPQRHTALYLSGLLMIIGVLTLARLWTRAARVH